jgi:TPR repeat protein
LPKPKRTIVWAIASVVAVSAVCFGAIFISQHKAKPLKPQPQPQPISSVAYTNLSLEALQTKATSGDIKAQVILGWRYYNGEGVATNQTEATNWWAKAAEQGNPGAMIAMGDVFYEKWENENSTNAGSIDPATGLPAATNNTNSVNYSESMNWYGKAAELDDTNAMWKLIWNGNSGSTSFGTIIDPATGLPITILPNSTSLRWLQKLAGRGDTEAMVTLGSVCVNKTNADEGLKWLHKAADMGETSAWTTLGSIYESGNGGVSKDIREAIRWYMKAATNRDVSSELHLAELYRDNEEIKNLQESFNWFLKVAQQFDSSTNRLDKIFTREAVVPVAKAYDKGLGVDQDKTEAIKWYKKAADAGETEAEWRLGVKYNVGDGVDIDMQKALQWYVKAANTPKEFGIIVLPGVAEAQRNIGYLYRDGEGVAKDAQEAFGWFMKAAETGDSTSQCEVAKAYNTGIGVLQDSQKAFIWYQKAAYQGNKLAQQKVGSIYFSANPNLPANRIEAYKWYALAAAQGDEDAAKFRDKVAPVMSVQELAEANRRAKAFSVGEPPATNSLPVMQVVRGIPTSPTRMPIQSASGEVPATVLDGIKQAAAREWPTDYEMQAYEIKNQVAAYGQLQQLSPGNIPADVFQQIKTAAVDEWPRDYEMQVYEIKNQVKAYQDLRK